MKRFDCPMLRARRGIAGLLAVAFALPALAADTPSTVPAEKDPALVEARLAVRRHDYGRAVSIWQRAADRGSGEAAYRLGVARRSGLGIEKDIDRAVHWFRIAVDRGHHGAQLALGLLHQNGTGVPRDRDEAIRLIGLAARGGHRGAKERLDRLRSSGSRPYAAAGARVTAHDHDPRAALAQSIRVGDPGSAREALARGAPIDGAPGDRRHWRPLVLAIDQARPEILMLLLAHGANPDIRSRIGEPALVLAIRLGDARSVAALLDSGADPEQQAVSGHTPLMEAARQGDERIVRRLLGAGARVEATLEDGTSAADIARRAGQPRVTRMLRRHGAPVVAGADPKARRRVLEKRSITERDRSPDLPPVVEAARRGDLSLLNEMIAAGIDLQVRDKEGGNALTRAAAAGHTEAVKRLLDAGVPVDWTGRDGATALMRAMASDQAGSEATLVVLLAAGANVHARDAGHRPVVDYAATGATEGKLEALARAGGSWTATTMANVLEAASGQGRIEVVRALTPQATDARGRNRALCRAVEQGHAEVVGLLSGQGASAEGDCGDGRRPLMVAAQHERPDLVEVLLAAGAAPDGNPQGSDSALIAAAGRGHVEIVRRLIEAGADVDRRGARRMTALMAAATGGHLEVATLLLKSGADRGKRADTGRTALDLAAQAGHEKLAHAIESHQSSWRSLFVPLVRDDQRAK